MAKRPAFSQAQRPTRRRGRKMTATLRSCFNAGLLALALTTSLAALAQSGADPALEAAGKCATSGGTTPTACGVIRKQVLDFLAQTSEEKAWAAGMSCDGG